MNVRSQLGSIDLFGLSEAFRFERSSSGRRDHTAKRIARRLTRQFVAPEAIEQEFGFSPKFQWTCASTSIADDQTAYKLLFQNSAGVRCETVALMPSKAQPVPSPMRRRKRATACISSQPGCGVGCPFCSTGELGYRGNLSAVEIAEQVYWAGMIAESYDRELRNVVFMGMGEPLHNVDNVVEALEMLTDPHLFSLPERRIAVSTVGIPAAMLRLAKAFPGLRIALSLHAVDSTLRRQLVPRALSDMEQLRSVIQQVNELQSGHPMWLEVVLFDGINDQREHAQDIVSFCEGLNVEVNLIPYNTAANSDVYRASPRLVREAFAKILRDASIQTTIRTSLGGDATAACGQLQAAAKNLGVL